MNRKKSTFDFSRLALIWALFLAVNAIMLYSCRDDYGEIKKNTSLYSKGKGLFIVNEGNFGNGNGSISFFSLDSLKILNDALRLKERHDSHALHGSIFSSRFRQFIVFAKIRAQVVLPTPLGPVKRNACARVLVRIAFLRVVVI
jgi:hypothetical protein